MWIMIYFVEDLDEGTAKIAASCFCLARPCRRICSASNPAPPVQNLDSPSSPPEPLVPGGLRRPKTGYSGSGSNSAARKSSDGADSARFERHERRGPERWLTAGQRHTNCTLRTYRPYTHTTKCTRWFDTSTCYPRFPATHAPLSFRPRFSSSPPRLCETFKAAHVRAPLPHRRPQGDRKCTRTRTYIHTAISSRTSFSISLHISSTSSLISFFVSATLPFFTFTISVVQCSFPSSRFRFPFLSARTWSGLGSVGGHGSVGKGAGGQGFGRPH